MNYVHYIMNRDYITNILNSVTKVISTPEINSNYKVVLWY